MFVFGCLVRSPSSDAFFAGRGWHDKTLMVSCWKQKTNRKRSFVSYALLLHHFDLLIHHPWFSFSRRSLWCVSIEHIHILKCFSVCPKYMITADDGSIGVIPPGRVGLSVIPASYDCEYHFLILSGWALHFSISTHYDNFLGDNILFTDNLGVEHV